MSDILHKSNTPPYEHTMTRKQQPMDTMSKRRPHLSTFAEYEIRFKTLFVAACETGDSDKLETFLWFLEFVWISNLDIALDVAIHADQHDITRRLLDAGIAPAVRTIYVAMKKKQYSLVETLLEFIEPKKLTENHDWDGLLFEAVRKGKTNIVTQLLQIGVPLEAEMPMSPPAASYSKFPVGILSYFLSPGYTGTPLSATILMGDSSMMNLLLHAGAQFNNHGTVFLMERDEDEDDNRKKALPMTPLAASVLRGDSELAKGLLLRGADPFDDVALHFATLLNQANIVDVLLRAFKQRYPCSAKTFGSAALYAAVSGGDEDMFNRLSTCADATGLVAGTGRFELWQEEEHFVSPLGAAIKCASSVGTHRVRSLLQQRGAPNSIVFECKKKKVTALLLAIDQGSIEAVKALVEAGADISQPARYMIQRTPLQAAVEAQNQAIVTYLLDKGADPNEPPAIRGGATALQLAARKGNMRIAAMLLQRGANVNAKAALHDGRTAFEGATEHGHIAMMLFLARNGLDPLRDGGRQGRRAIGFAESSGHSEAKQLAKDIYTAAKDKKATQDRPMEDLYYRLYWSRLHAEEAISMEKGRDQIVPQEQEADEKERELLA
ncbi:hypothetical protein N0V90_013188 [Kalmusia sp. IMI 367209]|nr:hypothetical protein N0V90_013188 [Kalmusia sp. IMI 367209]